MVPVVRIYVVRAMINSVIIRVQKREKLFVCPVGRVNIVKNVSIYSYFVVRRLESFVNIFADSRSFIRYFSMLCFFISVHDTRSLQFDRKNEKIDST